MSPRPSLCGALPLMLQLQFKCTKAGDSNLRNLHKEEEGEEGGWGEGGEVFVYPHMGVTCGKAKEQHVVEEIAD